MSLSDLAQKTYKKTLSNIYLISHIYVYQFVSVVSQIGVFSQYKDAPPDMLDVKDVASSRSSAAKTKQDTEEIILV